MISVKCVNFRTFLQISWGIVWGIVYFKFYPRSFSFSTFGYQYFELFSIFFGKCEHSEPQKRPHNPEVVGSSPASATIKIPGIHYEYRDFSDFLTLFEMAQLAVLGHFWVTFGSLGSKICFLGSHRPGFGRYFYAFFRSSTSAIHSEALTLFSSMMWEFSKERLNTGLPSVSVTMCSVTL